jgi:hypothetical protein
MKLELTILSGLEAVPPRVELKLDGVVLDARELPASIFQPQVWRVWNPKTGQQSARFPDGRVINPHWASDKRKPRYVKDPENWEAVNESIETYSVRALKYIVAHVIPIPK